MKLIIISGVSGSGKSVALHTLEDQGYLCIDNLPLTLLPALAEQIPQDSRYQKCAVGIDARNSPASLQDFPILLSALDTQKIPFEIVFLNADDDILLKRFSETRRKHPLSNDDIPLIEAIKKERQLLEYLNANADLHLDTSSNNVHQLRQQIIDRVARSDHNKLSISLLSFGFKHGIPSGIDFMFDIRCLPNPHWIPELRSLTGKDPAVIQFLEAEQEVSDMYQHIGDFLEHWLPRFRDSNRNYLSIAIGCTGGQHRSVYLVEALAKRLDKGQKILIRHRELI